MNSYNIVANINSRYYTTQVAYYNLNCSYLSITFLCGVIKISRVTRYCYEIRLYTDRTTIFAIKRLPRFVENLEF